MKTFQPPENEEQSLEIPNDAVVVTINEKAEANAKSGKQSGVNGVINISPMSLVISHKAYLSFNSGQNFLRF